MARRRFAKYTPDVGDDLRHRLYLLKEATGVPMAHHLREALATYLAYHENKLAARDAAQPKGHEDGQRG